MASRGRLDRSAVARSRGPGGALDRPGDAHGGEDLAAGAPHGCAHRGHAPLALLDAVDPAGGGRSQHPSGGATVEREGGTHRHDRTEAVGRLQRRHADPLLTLADVELDALASGLPQGGQRRAGGVGQGQAVGRRPAQPDQAQPEGEAAVGGAAQEPVGLEGDRQPVGGGPGEARGGDEVGQGAGPGFLDRAEDAHPLVDRAHTAYPGFHKTRS